MWCIFPSKPALCLVWTTLYHNIFRIFSSKHKEWVEFIRLWGWVDGDDGNDGDACDDGDASDDGDCDMMLKMVMVIMVMVVMVVMMVMMVVI